MAEHPKDVGIVHHVAAEIIGEKVKAQIAIQRQHQRTDRDRRHYINEHDCGAECGPGEQWHPHQVHPWRSAFVDGGGEIDAR